MQFENPLHGYFYSHPSKICPLKIVLYTLCELPNSALGGLPPLLRQSIQLSQLTGRDAKQFFRFDAVVLSLHRAIPGEAKSRLVSSISEVSLIQGSLKCE